MFEKLTRKSEKEEKEKEKEAPKRGALATIESGLNIIMNTTGILEEASKIAQPYIEEASKIAKPYIDEAVAKNRDENRKIYVGQYNRDTYVELAIEDVGLEVHGENEQEALDHLIKALNDFREKRIISNSKKLKKEQLKLLQKLDEIEHLQLKLPTYLIRVREDEQFEDENKNEFSVSKYIVDDQVVLKFELIDISVEGEDFEEAYLNLIMAIENYTLRPYFSESKKIRNEQMAFLEFYNDIKSRDDQIEHYLVVIKKEKKGTLADKFKLPEMAMIPKIKK